MSFRKADTVLVADDEQYNLEFVIEYLGSLGFNAERCETVDEAVSAMKSAQYRAIIADLSIPLKDMMLAQEPAVELKHRYPGLVIAEFARSHGHLDRQVIVYSVHDDPAVKAFASRLKCTYLLKGRPRQFKNELAEVFSRDPLAHKKRN